MNISITSSLLLISLVFYGKTQARGKISYFDKWHQMKRELRYFAACSPDADDRGRVVVYILWDGVEGRQRVLSSAKICLPHSFGQFKMSNIGF